MIFFVDIMFLVDSNVKQIWHRGIVQCDILVKQISHFKSDFIFILFFHFDYHQFRSKNSTQLMTSLSVSLMPVPTKVAFIKFRHRRDAAVALHLTNAILVDKLIQVIPWREGNFISLRSIWINFYLFRWNAYWGNSITIIIPWSTSRSNIWCSTSKAWNCFMRCRTTTTTNDPYHRWCRYNYHCEILILNIS